MKTCVLITLFLVLQNAYGAGLSVAANSPRLLIFRIGGTEQKILLRLASGKEVILDLPMERNHEVYYLLQEEESGVVEYDAIGTHTHQLMPIEAPAVRELASDTEFEVYGKLSAAAELNAAQRATDMPSLRALLESARLQTESGKLKAQIVFNEVMLAINGNDLHKAESLLHSLQPERLTQPELALLYRLKGKILIEQGRMRESLDILGRSIRLYDQLHRDNANYRGDLAWVSTQACDAKIHLVDETAMACLRAALALADNHPQIQAMIVHNMGGYHLETFQFKLSQTYFQQAAELYRSLGNRKGEAQATYLVGAASFQLGRFDAAAEKFYEGLEILGDYPSDNQRAYILSRLGHLHRWSGDDRKASDYFNEALTILGPLPSSRMQAFIRRGLADIEYRVGNYQAALENHLAFLAYAETLDAKIGARLARAELAVARDYMKLGDIATAMTFNRRASSRAKVWEIEAEVRLNSAELALITGDLDGARELAATALKDFQDQHRLSDALAAGDILLEVYRRRGEWSPAIEIGRQQLRLLKDSLLPLQQNSTVREFFTRSHNTASTLVDLLIKRYRQYGDQRDLEDALLVADQSRAIYLRREIQRERILTDRGQDRNWREVNRLNNALLVAGHSGSVAEQRALRLQRDTLLARIEANEDGIWGAEHITSSGSVKDIFDRLDQEKTYLKYVLGPTASYVFVIQNAKINVYQLPNLEKLSSEVFLLIDLLKRPNTRYKAEVRSLGEILVSNPLGGVIPSHLTIVPDGVLHYLPFAALDIGVEAGYKPLVSRAAIQHSLALSLEPKSESMVVASAAVVVTEDVSIPSPVQGKVSRLRAWNRELGALPWAAREALEIREIFGADKTLLLDGESATIDELITSQATSYDVLHFATHGFISDGRAGLAGLILNSTNSKEQKFVNWREFSRLDIQAKLVVLNGCETAVGRQVNGEGLMGVSRGFIGAGAPKTLTTLWKIADNAASQMMETFYIYLKNGNSVAESLRLAQISLLSSNPRLRHPFFWAGYIVNGASIN